MVILAMPPVSDAAVHHHKWKLSCQNWSPDCMQTTIISINGQYPGPTIRAREGDTIVVELENQIPTKMLSFIGMEFVRYDSLSIKVILEQILIVMDWFFLYLTTINALVIHNSPDLNAHVLQTGLRGAMELHPCLNVQSHWARHLSTDSLLIEYV